MKQLKIKQVIFREIYLNAISQLERRAEKCKKCAQGTNTMDDVGWTDRQYKASWMRKYYSAILKIEHIEGRLYRQGKGQVKAALDVVPSNVIYVDFKLKRKVA